MTYLMSAYWQAFSSYAVVKTGKRSGIEAFEEAFTKVVKERGLWREAMRLYHEPQLEARREHVDGLYSLMRDDPCATLGAELAYQWLLKISRHFPYSRSRAEPPTSQFTQIRRVAQCHCQPYEYK